jgi:hypothetical protein
MAPDAALPRLLEKNTLIRTDRAALQTAGSLITGATPSVITGQVPDKPVRLFPGHWPGTAAGIVGHPLSAKSGSHRGHRLFARAVRCIHRGRSTALKPTHQGRHIHAE